MHTIIRSRSRCRGAVGASCLLLAAVLATPLARAAGPASTPGSGGCALLMGGGGTDTGNQDVNNRWFVVNSHVSRQLMADLQGDGYHIVDFIVDIRDVNKRVAAMMQQLHSAGCGQVIQLTDDLSASALKPNLISRFAFSVSVIEPKIDPASPRTVHIDGSYKKDYGYPLTSDVMQHLSLSELARTMATDLENAGVLHK